MTGEAIIRNDEKFIRVIFEDFVKKSLRVFRQEMAGIILLRIK